MACGTTDFWIDQNADFCQTIALLTPPTTGVMSASNPGTPIDVTGWRFLLVGKDVNGHERITLDTALDNNSIQVATPTNGRIRLLIPASITAGFTWTRVTYNLMYQDAAGNIRRFLQGTINVSPGIGSMS